MIMENRWYYQLLMEEFGPVSEAMIRQLLQEGTLSASDLIRAEDSEAWVPAGALLADEPEPDEISDLSELSFDFEESTHQSRPPRGTVSAPPELETPPEFYTQSLGQVLGPMSMIDLLGMAESGALSGADQVRSGARGEWVLASHVAELKAALERGAVTTSEPVASAPPSTRRLFQTAGKAVEAETTINDSTTDLAEPGVDSHALAARPASAETTGTPVKSESTAATETSPSSSAESSPGANGESRGVKPRGKKKKSRNQEDDKLLNEIFDDVFADSPKATRLPIPGPAASGPSSPGVSSGTSTLKTTGEDPVTSSPAAPISPAPMAAPVMRPPAPMAAAAPRPVPSGSSRGFSFDGPVRNITLGLVGLILVGGLIWKFGLPLLTGVDTGKYASRVTAVLADFKALGEEPQASAWQDLAQKSRVEFMTYYKAMLEAGSTGPENVKCMEGLKNVIALSSTKVEDKEKRKELLGKLEKAVAGLSK